MQAVADSNLQKMARLWGTSAGPAAKTNQPPDYERRIVVMQAYLRNDDYRIIVRRSGRRPGPARGAGPDPAARPAPGTCRSP